MGLIETEQNLSIVVHCPYCSRTYEVKDADGVEQDIPALCKKCGCPMDDDELDKFADAEAMRASASRNRRQKKV